MSGERAVCGRCGASRMGFRDVCPGCGVRAEGDGLAVAWLLSSENLDERGLDAAAERIRAGQPLRPTQPMLDRARRAVGADLTTDPGLSLRDRVVLLVLSLLITPLPAWTAAIWWWRDRPRAAIQALGLAVPTTALFAAGWLWMVFA